jgi:hypothetical protein
MYKEIRKEGKKEGEPERARPRALSYLQARWLLWYGATCTQSAFSASTRLGTGQQDEIEYRKGSEICLVESSILFTGGNSRFS